MSRNSSRFPFVLALGGLAAVGAALFWLTRRSDDQRDLVVQSPLQSEAYWDEDGLEDVSPSSYAFEPEPLSDGRITARPSDRSVSLQSFDDLDALSPEELGTAFLTGATDTSIEPAPHSTAEISGFQIYDHEQTEEDLA
jgi:hypothetical protein